MAFAPVAADGSAQFTTSKIGQLAEEKIGGPAIATAKWASIAITRSGNVDILNVAGTEVGRNAGAVLAPFQLELTGERATAYLGLSQYEGDPLLRGNVDEFRAYSGAQTPSAVAELAQDSCIRPESSSRHRSELLPGREWLRWRARGSRSS